METRAVQRQSVIAVAEGEVPGRATQNIAAVIKINSGTLHLLGVSDLSGALRHPRYAEYPFDSRV
ncbi:hypothetical protein GCM10025772_13070 [Ferrimonas gelatinilytica]|uniref:Uncharacterized protein n=1 Tax=Ferrimonas gelatinilytica TaxID=1255257 RepID=A0ABP9S2R1_9GAMM